MDIKEFAQLHHAYENVDQSDFQRRARLLQALWRLEQGYDCGLHEYNGNFRLMGSRLAMPWAENELANFITGNIRDVVQKEVVHADAAKGQLFGKPRIFNDLLSSQPLCFNLFGELQRDLKLASELISTLTEGRFTKVHEIKFEYSPDRGSSKYTGDRSAFDVFFECETKSGQNGFIGMEVKYHENLMNPASGHKSRYDEIAMSMRCFLPDPEHVLREAPLQQIWRDHLLTGAVQDVEGYADGLFVILHPQDNTHCVDAISAYRKFLENAESFVPWTLETLVKTLMDKKPNSWPEQVFDRYCDFSKIEIALAHRTQLEGIIKTAKVIREKLDKRLQSDGHRVHFRPSSGGISMISLLHETAQLGSELEASDIVKDFETLFEKHCRYRIKGRETPEKELQSYLIRESYSNGRLIKPIFEASGVELTFVTDEIALSCATNKIVCDILALRKNAQGQFVPVLMELKSSRDQKELIRQVTSYAAIMETHKDLFEQLYSALLGIEICFALPVEKWIVWPSSGQENEPSEAEFAKLKIRVVCYKQQKERFSFTVCKAPK